MLLYYLTGEKRYFPRTFHLAQQLGPNPNVLDDLIFPPAIHQIMSTIHLPIIFLGTAQCLVTTAMSEISPEVLS